MNNAIVLDMDFVFNHKVLLINIAIIPVVISILQTKLFQNSKKHSYQIKDFSKYIATRQATNDLLEVIIYNIKLSNILINKSKDIIKSLQQNKDETISKLDKVTRSFSEYVKNLEAGNKSSIERSYSNDLLNRQGAKSPFKSLFFWVPTFVSLLFLYFNFLSTEDMFIHPLLLILIILVEIVLLFVVHKSFNKYSLLNKNTNFQIQSIIELFNIRRSFIEDTNRTLLNQIEELNKFSGYCKSVPQAKGFLKAINLLKRNAKALSEIFDITNINVEVPLISLSDYLNKAVENKYKPVAEKHNIKLQSNIQPGLSLCISPKNIDRLVEPIIENSLTYSAGGESILINGIPKSNRNIIEIIDNGSSMSDDDLQGLFELTSHKEMVSSESKIGLSLRIVKLILCTISGELKLYSSNNKGIKVQLIMPRTKKQEIIKITPKIGKSISPIK